MAPLPEHRRRRYKRQPLAKRLALTPLKLLILARVADFEIVSLPMLARLLRLTEKSTRWHCRALYDAGLLDIIAVHRTCLAEPGCRDTNLIYGSAPNLYILTRAGSKLLLEAGLMDEVRIAPQYSPKNSLFLAHTLAVKEVRVWLELAAKSAPDQQLVSWQDGSQAAIDLKRREPPKAALPDAWFSYRLGERVLVGLVEVDRATERGELRWKQKLAAYTALFASSRLKEVTGYTNARVVVIAPTPSRRDKLADLIARHGHAAFQNKFWLADRSVLDTPDLIIALWRRPSANALMPLIAPELLAEQQRHEHLPKAE